MSGTGDGKASTRSKSTNCPLRKVGRAGIAHLLKSRIGLVRLIETGFDRFNFGT